MAEHCVTLIRYELILIFFLACVNILNRNVLFTFVLLVLPLYEICVMNIYLKSKYFSRFKLTPNQFVFDERSRFDRICRILDLANSNNTFDLNY